MPSITKETEKPEVCKECRNNDATIDRYPCSTCKTRILDAGSEDCYEAKEASNTPLDSTELLTELENSNLSIPEPLAAEVVLYRLLQVGMFRGKFDAKNGSKEFMYGVEAVMENIASMVSEECYQKFENEFIRNLTESEEQE